MRNVIDALPSSVAMASISAGLGVIAFSERYQDVLGIRGILDEPFDIGDSAMSMAAAAIIVSTIVDRTRKKRYEALHDGLATPDVTKVQIDQLTLDYYSKTQTAATLGFALGAAYVVGGELFSEVLHKNAEIYGNTEAIEDIGIGLFDWYDIGYGLAAGGLIAMKSKREDLIFSARLFSTVEASYSNKSKRVEPRKKQVKPNKRYTPPKER